MIVLSVDIILIGIGTRYFYCYSKEDTWLGGRKGNGYGVKVLQGNATGGEEIKNNNSELEAINILTSPNRV